jgi:hypothetical protein
MKRIFPITEELAMHLRRSGIKHGPSVRVHAESYEHFAARVESDYSHLSEAERHALAVVCCLTHPDHAQKHRPPNWRWIFVFALALLAMLLLASRAHAQGTSQIDVITFQANDGTNVGSVAAPFKFKAGANCSIVKSGSTYTFNCSGGAAAAGGSNSQVQFNSAGSLGGVSNLTSDGTVTTAKTGANWLFADPVDATKKIQLDLSNIATLTTRTVNVPDANSTLAQSVGAAAHKFITAMSAQGVFTQAQPDYSDLTGTPTLPANTTATAHQFFTAYNSATGAFTKAQPAFSDISGTATSGQLPAAVVYNNQANTYSGGGLQDFHAMKFTPPTSTVASLPSAATNTNEVYEVTDGASATDCTVGSGSTFVWCASNGSAWVALGGGTGGGGGVTSVSGTANQITSTGGSTPVLALANPLAFPGEVTFAASTSSAASANIPSGTVPTTPANGDIARDANGIGVYEDTTKNGLLGVRSDSATANTCPSNIAGITAASQVLKTCANAGSAEFLNESASALTANQIVLGNGNGETQPLGSLGTTTTVLHGNAGGAPAFGAVARADLGADAVGWQFLCTATSTTSTVSCTPSTARKHVHIRLDIGGYSGGGGAARFETGNTSTVDTGTNYSFGGLNIASGTSTAPTVSGVGSGSTAQEGCPVSGSTTTAGRLVTVDIDDLGTQVKYAKITSIGVNTAATSTPNIAEIGCFWSNTTSGLGVFQFKACSATTGTCTTVNFVATTKITVWGRDDN